ncbi:tail fiber protein [Providencia rettgeri]|uniref:tail fiber protein n=1 Tax=Providencia rettgeri TaxID=587 RepID=UPI001BA4E943|nr:tail fiber protein [Providencia rettgeri]MBS0861375.1 tail fiber protein [Providencia rettgeri]MBS0875198.1 tail fiber protein [Providencia rettgeri]MBS0921500.1 tail fiber protein [Providencia rettgeri]
MKKIGDITNTADKNGEFTDGNVAAGTPPTQLMGAWFNSVQREILNVLAKAGIPQSATKEDQLAEAITKLVAGAGYLPTGYSYSKIESDGRYQPKGNYAPAGDYATNTALTNGLNGKFDKTGGVINGGITVTGNTTSNGDVIQVVNAKNNQSIQLDTTNDGLARINSRQKNEQTYTHLLPSASGIFMQLGDYGFAGRGLLYNYSQSALETTLFKDSTLSQIFRNDTTNTLTYRYSPSLLMRTGDTSALISIDVDTANVRATSVLLKNGARKTNELYGTANTNIDKNGYIRTGSSTVDIVGVPVGGSILWNTSATIPDGFWPNEGRSFSATDYPELAKVFPSLKLPDDRGYAIRAADNGRGKDPGRTVGTYQEDAMMNLTGEFTARTDSAGVATGVFTKANAGQTMAQGNNNILGTVSFNAGNQVPTANEFRMKNVSKILITRIK